MKTAVHRCAISRRRFVGAGALLSGAMAALPSLLVRAATGEVRKAGLGEGGYGPLAPAGPEFALPAGFRYRRLTAAGERMSDGHLTPSAPDGMAAFALPNGNVRLIRNHEIDVRPEGTPVLPGAYDPPGGGGTVSLEIHPISRAVISHFVSLSGTVLNCAGGPTPWASWLSCEETTAGTAQGGTRPHGYVFEVPVTATSPVEPVPLKAMGRFTHEAVAVDPATGIIYETEDLPAAGMYRFLPERPWRRDHPQRPADLRAGGQLQMLKVRGRPWVDLDRDQEPGRALAVEWVDIGDPDPADAERNPLAVFGQGRAQGAARFRRLEGCWFADGNLWLSSTDGGDSGNGQVWRYRPGTDGGELTLVFESPGPDVLGYPDNLCVSPRGGVILCEDEPRGGSNLRGLTPDGRIFDFALNLHNARELTGACFSPDGQTLFVNIQWEPGSTFAIWGPWEHGAL